MICTEIRVFDLSIETANRLGVSQDTSVLLEIPPEPEFSLRFSKDVEKLSEINKINTEGALGFSLPATKRNNAVFADFDPLVLDNRVTYYSVSVRCAGQQTMFTRLIVLGKNEDSKTWTLELQRDPNHWADLASQLKINELDYGSFVMSKAAIEGNWTFPAYEGDFTTPDTGQRPYYWPLVDYGGWCDQTPVPQDAEGRYKSVAVEDFRPWLSWVYMLRAGFCAIGWTIDGVILDADWVKRLWVYDLRQDYYVASKVGGRLSGRTFTRQLWDFSNPLILEELNQYVSGSQIPDGGGAFFAGIENLPDVALKYHFHLQGDFHNDRASSFLYAFQIFELDSSGDWTGEILESDPIAISETLTANEVRNIILDFDVTLKPGQRAAINIGVLPNDNGFYIQPGLFVEITPNTQSLFSGDSVEVSECVSDRNSLLDWLKAFLHFVDGRIETDFDTRTVTVHPNKRADVWGDTVPGFLLDEDPAIDITDLVVVNSIKTTQIRPDLKRYTRLEFADSTDAYIQSLNLTEPAYSRTLLNGLEYPNEIESIQNLLVEPTYEGQPADIAAGAGSRNPLPFIPRLWDNTDGNRSFNIGPRVLYAFDPVRQENPSPVTPTDQYTSFFFDSVPNPSNVGLVEEFGYATMLPTWTLDPLPTVVPNVVFGTQDKDLFVNFYLGITQDRRDGILLDLLMMMRMTDYVGYDFRTMFAFRYNGIPLRVPMTGIRDFAPCSETATPATFFVSPAETECCDLPCGCQFTICDYYQDLSIYLRQSTLDLLQVSSFTVDGIELLTSVVSFGTLKMVSVDGMPYIMNMVDTLNSIGAPYFTFALSTREHPEKGKRFFTIKNLACQPFRILITYDGDPVYLYTQAEQQTQWFTPGTWNDIGYGTEFFSAPDNCTTSTEY